MDRKRLSNALGVELDSKLVLLGCSFCEDENKAVDGDGEAGESTEKDLDC